MARAAAAFTAGRVWQHYGFARLDDHARERLHCTGRWVRDLAAVGRALQTLPGLEEALTGRDGGPPLTLAAARIVSTRASPATLSAWLRAARRLPVRELRREASTGMAGPGDRPEPSDDESTEIVRLKAPEAVRVAFDEGFDLYRAVEGYESSVSGFIEALVAEGAGAGLTDLAPAPDRPDAAGPAGSRQDNTASSASLVGPWPRQESDAADRDDRLRRLLALRGALERCLDHILVRIDLERAWIALGFRSLEHYAEARLGMCRRTVRERSRLGRGLRRLPELREAFERGEVGLMAALEVVRLLRDAPQASPENRRAWVERARRATVKRLRDEVRLLERRRGLGLSSGEVRPLTDEEWQSSLIRRTGDARRRIRGLSARTRDSVGSDHQAAPVSLSWRLRRGLANDFRRALRSAAGKTVDGRGTPDWRGLLALLECFVDTWDVDQSPQRPGRIAIYVRDGWRCMAPGCTSRRNLEDHHVVYRSQGGDDATENRVCLCRFHHQRGEHGELARVRGRAPLGLIWSLGRGGRGGAFRNEMRL